MSLRKPLEQIVEADLQDLIDADVSEGLTIEFKAGAPALATDGEKHEFLADVTAFANASGGDLIYGVDAPEGEAVGFIPFELDDLDGLRQRVQQILDGKVQPKLPGIGIHALPVAGGKALVVRIPRSWSWPHGFRRGGGAGPLDFWTRSGAGKRRMDIDELRAAFAASVGTLDKAEEERTTSVAGMIAGSFPIELDGLTTPWTAVHLIPLEALTRAQTYDLSNLPRADGGPKPLGDTSSTGRHVFDGVLIYSGVLNEEGLRNLNAYLLIHRDGRFETVTGKYPWAPDGNQLNAPVFDIAMIQDIKRLLDEQSALSVPPPIWVGISVHGVEGMEFGVPAAAIPPHDAGPIDRDLLMLPPILIEDPATFDTRTLRPALDAFWNAAGYRRSESFDAEGNWARDEDPLGG